MKFLILAAVLALAAAAPRPQEYHDDVFHFSSLKGLKNFNYDNTKTVVTDVQPTFVKKTVVQEVQQPSYVVKSAPSVTTTHYVQKVAQPVYTQVVQKVAQPVYTQQVVHQPSVLVRTVEQEVPAVQTQHVHHIHQHEVQPVVSHVHEVPASVDVSTRHYHSHSEPIAAVRILKQVQEVDPSGLYVYSFATENGISANEQGTVREVQSAEGPAAVKEGSYSYTGDDGQTYTVTYIADENGFRASGAHLPVAPEIPAEIQRSLEIIASQPEKYDDNGNLIKA